MIIQVVGAAIFRDSSVLLAQRSESMSLAGQWEFPGGKIKNETPKEALIRELKEELNIEVRPGKSIGKSTVNSDSKMIELEVFQCEIISGKPQPLEHSNLQWVKIYDVQGMNLALADIPIAAKIVAGI